MVEWRGKWERGEGRGERGEGRGGEMEERGEGRVRDREGKGKVKQSGKGCEMGRTQLSRGLAKL